MRITRTRVREEHGRIRDRTEVVETINHVRESLGEAFGEDVDEVTAAQYHDAVDEVFADGDVAVNVTGLVGILRDLDVEEDYPGFVVDEVLGRELAATIAGGRPLSLLAESTFHYADVTTHGSSGTPAGEDDLNAALAAGFQTVLPGWDWRAEPSPFDVA